MKVIDMAFNDNSKRVHFVNVVKITKDFLGEHCSPLTEGDCTMLCEKQSVIDSINAAIKAAGISGIKVQLNWSDDQGQSWQQYPQSR